MKNLKFKWLLLSIILSIASINTAWAVTYNPSGVAQQTMQSQQVMQTGRAYNGTVYEPFSNTTPSEQSYSPAKAPGGPHREQASGRNPGEVDPEAASDQSPIGEPWVMVLFAMFLAGVIAIRARKKRIVEQTENNNTMKQGGKYIAIVALLLTLGVGQMWADDTYMYVVGDPINSWANNTTYRIGSSYGADHKYCIVVFMKQNDHFALSSGSARYVPKSDNYELGIGTAAYQGDYNNEHQNWSFKYTGPTGLVKICIDQNGLNDTGYPYVWVEKQWNPTDDINDVLTGSKVMFYWGDTYNNDDGSGWKQLYSNTGRTGQVAYWLAKRKVTTYSNNGVNSHANFAWGAASLSTPTAQYYIYNNSGDWNGHQMGEAPQAGKVYIATSDGAVTGDNRSTATFTNSGSYTIEYGTANSGVSASCDKETSAIAENNSIYGYYISEHDANSWSSFNPSDADELVPGTYDVAAIVTDGIIYVKGATATLTVHETRYDVTLTKNNNAYGSVNESSVEAGAYTAPTITATPNAGFRFTGWTITSGSVTFLAGASSATTTIHASSNATVQANFAPRYVVYGSVWGTDVAGSGMPGWSDDSKTFDYVSADTFRRTLTLEGNKEYKFRIHDLVTGNNLGGENEYNVELNAGHTTFDKTGGDVTFSIGGSDEITFEIDGFENGYPQAHVLGTKPSYSISFDSKTLFADGTTGSTTGGTVIAVDGYDFDLAVVGKVKAGGTAVFTAAPEEGYTLAGWYSDASCTTAYTHGEGGAAIDNAAKTLTLSSISADKTVYAKFVENATTVSLFASPSSSGHIEVQVSGEWKKAKDLSDPYHINVGVHTHYNIKAVVDLSGRFFEKWRVSAIDQDFYLGSDTEADYDEDHATTVIYGKGNGRASQLLYADFTELEKVYFRNVKASTGEKLWSDVYVYFDVTWSENSAKSAATTDASYIAQMTEIGSTKVYQAYIPRAFTRKVGDNHNGQVAFSNHDFGNNSGDGQVFSGYEGLKWGSYTKSMDMCVPSEATKETVNSTVYHDCYWKKYYAYPGLLGGYYLKKHSGGEYSNAGTDYYFKIVRDNVIQATYEIKDADVTYQFMIEGFNGIQYKTDDIEADEEFPVTMSAPGDTPYFTLTPNMEGTYTFTIDQSEEKMKLTVHYPVEVGDYRIKHSYNDGSAKTAYSNAVKAAKVADTDTVSLFLYKSDEDNATTLQKCTCINASTKQPVWTDQNTTNLSGFNSLEKSGVYKIGLTITDNAVSNTPEIKKYDGHYYIRVKGANTRNHLTNGETKYGSGIGTKFTPFVKNSAFEDDYDHYWVDWFLASGDAGGGVQSITATIQNDFNPDLAGKVADGVSTLSSGANVRYGYDSESNTLSYQMITGAGSSVKIKNTQGAGNVEVLTASTPSETWTDAYSSEPSATDAQNWMYEFTARVKENCTATIKSSYNGDDVELATNKKLLGGAGSGTHYVDVIYDFKTNRLITAWRPSPSSNYQKSISLESNLMLVRTEDGSPTTLNLIVDPEDDSKEGSLNDITQIYTVMHFTRDAWDASSRTTIGGGYTDAFYWISLPYDCYVSEIFGLDKYGDQWVIQTYHGDYRAQKGWWAETESWWYDLDREDIMKANQGYVIRLTNLESSGNVFTAVGVNDAYLYFPSANATALNIGRLGESTTTTVPEHKCTIVRDSANHAGDPNYDRRFIDSNWNIIGSPCFNSAKISTTGWSDDETEGHKDDYKDITEQLQFFYTWSVSANTPVYEVQDATDVAGFEFKATHAYFVQYAGDLTWVPYESTPFVGFKAPAADRDVPSNQTIRLSLSQNEVEADATYISRMAEGATEGYDLNMDLSKVMNSRKANIYTLAGYYKMAGNCLPDTVSVVPVGVRTYTAGTYTFSIPEGTNGTGVVLVDNVTNTRTNLALTDYTVTLAKGTIEGRFSLELSPIAQTPTDIEQTGADVMDCVRKVMVDGILYIVKDGKVFDARGNRVQ